MQCTRGGKEREGGRGGGKRGSRIERIRGGKEVIKEERERGRGERGREGEVRGEMREGMGRWWERGRKGEGIEE